METTRHTTAAPRYEDDIDLLRYGRFLASYWMLLAACALVGALTSLAVARWLPPRYQSTVTLALTTPGVPTAVVLTPASAKALLADLTIVTETLKEAGLDRETTARGFVDDALDVLPVPSTNLVNVQVTLADPDKAQKAASLLATKMINLTLRIDRESGIGPGKTLDEELADAQAARDTAQRDLLDYEVGADVERLEADVRERRASTAQRTELYRKRLELEQRRTNYLERDGVYRSLLKRRDDVRNRPETPAQVHVVGQPIRPNQPLPRSRARFAAFGAVLGTMAGIIAALLINKRRLDRSVQS